MSNLVLGAATQQNLLSLQNIDSQMSTTQNALSTGLKVSSAVDNAVAFFEAQSLNDRAGTLSTAKTNIDQGIQSVTAATQGISSAISILQQMQGIVESAQTETATQRGSAATQFNTLASQLNNLMNDTSYQGLNLVNSTKSNLTLQFSNLTSSSLKISGENLLVSKTLTTGSVGNKASVMATALAGAKFSAASSGSITIFNKVDNTLTAAISTYQAASQTFGANVSLLQTRANFTSQYAATLQSGANSLTVADVNAESTNLVTLQTRQSLAIQSLSIATQSEKAVLSLFR